MSAIPNNPRYWMMNIRVTLEELTDIDDLAVSAGLTRSAYVRKKLGLKEDPNARKYR